MDLNVPKPGSFVRALSLALLAAVGSTASPLFAWQGQAPAAVVVGSHRQEQEQAAERRPHTLPYDEVVRVSELS